MAPWRRGNTRGVKIVLLGVVLIAAVGISRSLCGAREGAWPTETSSRVATSSLATTASPRTEAATSVTPNPSLLPPTPSPLTTSTTRVSQTLASIQSSTTQQTSSRRMSAQVVAVIDGDTLEANLVGLGREKVRLLGIDAPESDEEFYGEAKRELARFVTGSTVTLETDIEERDRYGRLLAYVWAGGLLVNAELLRLGVATLYLIPPNVKYMDLLKAAQDEARAAARGMWGATGAAIWNNSGDTVKVLDPEGRIVESYTYSR